LWCKVFLGQWVKSNRGLTGVAQPRKRERFHEAGVNLLHRRANSRMVKKPLGKKNEGRLEKKHIFATSEKVLKHGTQPTEVVSASNGKNAQMESEGGPICSSRGGWE